MVFTELQSLRLHGGKTKYLTNLGRPAVTLQQLLLFFTE
jgi:hypothetical protein